MEPQETPHRLLSLSNLLMVLAFMLVLAGILGYFYEKEPPDGFLHRRTQMFMQLTRKYRQPLEALWQEIQGKTANRPSIPEPVLPPVPVKTVKPEPPVHMPEKPALPAGTAPPSSADKPEPPLPVIQSEMPETVPPVKLPPKNFQDDVIDLTAEPSPEQPANLPTEPAVSAKPETIKPSGKPGDIYTWVDEQGVRHFSNGPPPEGMKEAKRLEWSE